MKLCPWCRQEYAPAVGERCPHCGAIPPEGEELASAGQPEPGAPPAPPSLLDLLLGPEGTGLPWERRREHGFWRGLGRTLRAVLFSPLGAFRAMRREGGSGDAALYALIVGTAAFALVGAREVLYAHGAGRLLGVPFGPAPAESPGTSALTPGLPVSLALVLASAPLVALALPAAAALGAHLFFRLCRRGRPLALSYRVNCYALGSASALAVLPLCGHVLAALWYLAIAAVGFFVVHRAGALQAVGAAVLPPLVLAAAAGVAVLAIAWSLRT